MKTKPLYLDDSYLKEMDARVLEVLTVFYPMGGGQATDQGELKGDDWI